MHLPQLLLSETQAGLSPLTNSNVLFVTVLRLVGNRAKDNGKAERIFLHHVPIWKTHMTLSSTNEEVIALSDLIPNRYVVGKLNI